MALPRQTPQDEIKRRIRDEAEALFGHYGYAKTAIGDIAKACGMSPGNIYRFYRNKQAIALAVVENYFDEQAEKMRAARDGETDPEARLKATITAGVVHLVETMDGNPRIFEMAEFVCNDFEGEAMVRRQTAWKTETLGAIVADGIEAGVLRPGDPGAVAWSILLATTGFWMPQALIAWHEEAMILDDLATVLDLVLTGIRAD
ncbi:MAG: TetR/AcrR family transcriptional regulator [Pseudomonadota bacterium]